MNSSIIPIFFACDDAFAKFTVVTIHSIIKNASKEFHYSIHILHTGVSEEMQQITLALANENFDIQFDNVSEYLEQIAEKLPIRDYYSKTTYFRLFIAEMFPQYSKAIYIDSDAIVTGDISKLYHTDIGDAYLGACHEQAMVQEDVYGTYVEKVIGISRHNFFNAGLILINCEQFRQRAVLDKFIEHLHVYNFVVTQDEDYLNLICKDHVFWLDQRWNTEMFGNIPYPISEAYILHYIMTSKPWHYEDCRHGDIFWSYAKETKVYDSIRAILEGYTDAERERDQKSCEALMALAYKEIHREDNYLNRINRTKRSRDRVEILQKIDAYERAGRFDEDVEEDPPTKPLPEDMDYEHNSLWEKIKTKFAFAIAHRFVYRLLREKKMIVKEIRGLEHFKGLRSGAIITCNHFNAFDSFAIQMAYEAAEQKKRTFYRIIREGNYTSFPGFYGFLMRNCNTLPLASGHRNMRKFLTAVDRKLTEGNFVLVYPEQSMWWNYRKPKPLKPGAFTFAARNNVPVLPCFITMKDSDVMGEDGFYVQEYTIHISPPIYPDRSKSYRANAAEMQEKNYTLWKDIYESEYQIPMSYTCDDAQNDLAQNA